MPEEEMIDISTLMDAIATETVTAAVLEAALRSEAAGGKEVTFKVTVEKSQESGLQVRLDMSPDSE